mmetsp:Transcript_8487/g.30273  ORF Transcript_8487/g.30273 Transcript_8487/m.30273 type:complete len:134 (+) Transcript_8487:498-899(+)
MKRAESPSSITPQAEVGWIRTKCITPTFRGERFLTHATRSAGINQGRVYLQGEGPCPLVSEDATWGFGSFLGGHFTPRYSSTLLAKFIPSFSTTSLHSTPTYRLHCTRIAAVVIPTAILYCNKIIAQALGPPA